MTQDAHKTLVIFRKFKKENTVIALFPELPGTSAWYADCLSYMHTGQHGAASIDLSHTTIAAKPEEIAPLKRELEGLGYNLTIIKRFSPVHLAARKRAVEGFAA